MKGVYGFKQSLAQGQIGEIIWYEANCKDVVKLDGMTGDFKLHTGEVVELKSDSWDMARTPNFFMERWSNVEMQTPGGPWQSRGHGVDLFVYFYPKNLTYFTFPIGPLLERLETLIPHIKPTEVKNTSHVTVGYRVPRDAITDLAEVHTISLESKRTK